MHDKTRSALGRIDRYVREWIVPALTVDSLPLQLTKWEVPGEPVPFTEVPTAEFTPVEVGQTWGQPWGTTWIHATAQLPPAWPLEGTRAEVVVNLGWIDDQPGFQAEGAAFSATGELLKGISPRNNFVPLNLVSGPGGGIDFFVEAASNPDVPDGCWTKPTVLGDKATAGADHLYRLRALEVCLVDEVVEGLVADIVALRGLVDTLPDDSARRAEIITALEKMCDVIDADAVRATAALGASELRHALDQPAIASAHQAYAVGHAHIDSAWLWPTRETERKVGRTVGNVLAVMEYDDEFKYAFSSAQQYAWIKAKYPELYRRLKEQVAKGRIVPVGGMWVESDTNMPSGESLVRQFLAGKSFFKEEFGIDPTSVWLPDSFGYTGAIPQIAHLAGCDDFLTQKLCWNDTNKMPHSTFWWEGIDGTRVFTHFPPVDTYNSDLSAGDLARAARNYCEKGKDNRSLVPFGYGDGGGGPTREMLARGRRYADLEGSPQVRFASPDEFFADARAGLGEEAATWVGEMYLEFHRGTYTSQRRTKLGNRVSESLLFQAELWAATAAIQAGAEYPYDELERIWETVLLQQFHDILPGSSIAWVHREAEANYHRLEGELRQIIDRSLRALTHSSTTSKGAGAGQELLANASPMWRAGVAPFSVGAPHFDEPASLSAAGDNWVLENQALRVTVDSAGLVVSIIELSSGREVIPSGHLGNLLQFYRDIPNNWEAWDLDEHYRRVEKNLTQCEPLTRVDIQEDTSERASGLCIKRSFSQSSVEQQLWLASGADPTLHVRTHVDWHERQKVLKLAFPLDLVTSEAESEMQFGYVRRPTHDNTTWDAAKFETVAHRWVRVAEGDFAVALANDGTYGHDVTRIHTDAGPATLVRASLLRAPLFPDPVADQGEHDFHHALVIGADVLSAYQAGYDLNLQTVVPELPQGVEALVRVDGPAQVASIKLAHDRSGDLIVRVFEAQGCRSRSVVHAESGKNVTLVDVLERPLVSEQEYPRLESASTGSAITLKPFQVATLRIKR